MKYFINGRELDRHTFYQAMTNGHINGEHIETYSAELDPSDIKRELDSAPIVDFILWIAIILATSIAALGAWVLFTRI